MATVQVPQRFADAVRATRNDIGMSVAKAAKAADIDRVTWKRVENAETVQDTKLRAVERLIGFTVDMAEGHEFDTAPPAVGSLTDVQLLEELLRRAQARRTG